MADNSEVLMEITRAHLDTGLRGYPVGTCRTSFVDPYKGLHYVGYPISELWELDPEAVVFLLFNKHLPSDAELDDFKADLARRATLDPRVVEMLAQLPREAHPMQWFIAGLLYMGMTDCRDDFREDALNCVARLPELVANVFRLRNGWGEPRTSRPELGLVENCVQLMDPPDVDRERLTELLRVFYVLHLDHGGGNLSTFTGKAVASGLADTYAALAAAMAGLYGPRHGRANQAGLDFVRRCGTDDPAEAEAFVRAELAAGRLVYGFGHAVLRAEDPRATIEYALARKLAPDHPLVRTALTLREVAVKVLSENPKVSNPYPNVDAVSGTLLSACGLSDPSYYTVLFGFSRCSGISAQIVDERTVARGGKGVPIYRPKYLPVEQPVRSLQD